MSTDENSSVDLLKSRIDEQGNLVRKLKSDTNTPKVLRWGFSDRTFCISLGRDRCGSGNSVEVERRL